MKFGKYLLAFILLITSSTSLCLAGTLEEAIKGTEVSGYARYRLNSSKSGDDDRGTTNRYRMFMGLGVPITGGMIGGKLNTSFNFNNEGNKKNIDEGRLGTDNIQFNLKNLYFSFGPYDPPFFGKSSTINVGLQPVGIPMTGDGAGSGIAASSSIPVGVGDVTIRGYYFNQLAGVDFDETAITEFQYYEATSYNTDGEEITVSTGNSALAGLSGSFSGDFGSNKIAAGGHYVQAMDAAGIMFAEVSGEFGPANVKAQYGMSMIDDALEKSIEVTNDQGNTSTEESTPKVADTTYYGVEAGATINIVSLRVGYSAASTEDKKLGTISLEESGGVISGWGYLGGYDKFNGKYSQIFVNAGVSTNGLGANVRYILEGSRDVNDLSSTEDKNGNEIYTDVSYAWNDKMTFKLTYTTYTDAQELVNDNPKQNDTVQFEAKYSF